MINKDQKTYRPFSDIIEKQREVKAAMPRVTLEEARAIVKWLKDGTADKKQRPIIADENKKQ